MKLWNTQYTYTQTAKQGVGSGIAIYFNNKLTHQIKRKLNNRNTPRRVKVFTDSKITIFSLKNAKNRIELIEEIRRKTNDLEKENWHLDFTWIKVHAGNGGNDVANQIDKEAIKNSEMCYNKIPISEIARQEAE